MKKVESFVLYNHQSDLFDHLTDEQAGVLVKAIYRYCGNGREKPDFGEDGSIKMAFVAIQGVLDQDNIKYLEKCKKNSDNMIKRWADANKH